MTLGKYKTTLITLFLMYGGEQIHYGNYTLVFCKRKCIITLLFSSVVEFSLVLLLIGQFFIMTQSIKEQTL